MDLVKYELEVPKESKEVLDAAISLVSFFMQKKPLAEITLLLPGVLAALDGISQVKDEIASDKKDELAAYAVHQLWAALQPPAPSA